MRSSAVRDGIRRLPPRADGVRAQLVVHLLDYVSVDYPAFVKDGKVLDDGEYKEQQEFAAQVQTLLGAASGRARTRRVARRGGAAQGPHRCASARRRGRESCNGSALARDRRLRHRSGAEARRSICSGARALFQRVRGLPRRRGSRRWRSAKGLDPAPADFHDHDRVAQRSVYGLYNAITLGVAGTAMKGFRAISDDDRWALAFYVATLGADPARTVAGEKLWRADAARAKPATCARSRR